MKTWRSTRFLAMILVIAMLIQMLPVQALATEQEQTSQEAPAVTSDVSVLGEVEELREEDTKHFRLSDGSYIAVSYGVPVHHQGSEGQWMDIDNSLSLNSDSAAYQLNRTDTAVAFQNTLTNGTVLTTSRGNASITMSLLDTAEAERMIAGNPQDETVPETTAETIPEETIPETMPVETVPETMPIETVPETMPETIPQETTAQTEPETMPQETTVPQETVLETVTEETAASEQVYSELAEESEETPTTETAETFAEETAETLTDETVAAEVMAEEGSAEETQMSTPTEAEETAPEETVAETMPAETEAVMATEETAPVEVTEETQGQTEPAETAAQTEPAEENLDAATELAYSREATARIVDDVPTMLTLQESYGWNVNDVIPKNLQSSLVYENVFPNVDLLYTAFGNNIKEQIVVNAPQSGYRYDFLLDLNGLTAAKAEDGSISLTDTEGNQLYKIPAPYMEDNNGEISPEVSFTLHEAEQGVILTVEANAEWINAAERAFPVKIDPSFTIISGKALDEIYSVYTMEAAPNDTTLGRQYLYVGAQPYSTSNDGRYRLYMHFNDMPSIPAGSEVVNAQLNLYQFQYTQRECPSFPIGVYEVTTDLPSAYSSYYDWFTKMTWRRDQPSYDASNAIDYVMVDATKGYRTWNMTELVKKWYAEKTSNTTAALVMMNEEEIDTYHYFASATFYAYAGSIPPILIVSYRNNTGIEPYYTYATLGGASAGTAYIADATGQLKVGKELVQYESSVNPFSLNLIYNSDYFSQSSGTDYQPPSKMGLNMSIGAGWTLDCIQKMEPETISDIPYLKYSDGDGTIHYFMKDDTPKDAAYPYYDEDGLGLKAKSDGSNNYTMADDQGNVWIFTGSYLTSMRDETGNQININYADGRITSITQVNKGQTAIEVAKFAYNGNTLVSVTDNAGNVYTLGYSGGNLTSIQLGSTPIAAYEYDGYRLNKMVDKESSYSLVFTYGEGKVSSYREVGGSETGATVEVSYPSHTQTSYRDYGQDRKKDTADDILTHYLFDYARRTANAYTTDNGGKILGATNAAYYEGKSGETTDKRNNRTVRSASIGIASQPLLKNASLEVSDEGWSHNETSRGTAKARTGSYAIQGSMTSNKNIHALYSSPMLKAGQTYTFSGYVNTSEVTKFEGAGVFLMVLDTDKQWSSNYVNYTTSATVDGGWMRLSVTFTAPRDDAYGLSVCNFGGIGTFYADDFQLEEGHAPSGYNLLENGSMEMPDYGWTMNNGAAFSTTKAVAGSTTSLRVAGNPTDKGTNAYQDVAVNQPGTQTYVLSGWVNANAVPDEDENKEKDLADRSKECGLRATLTYSDGGTEDHYTPFNTDLTNTWQFASLTVVPKQTSKTVTKIRVTCAYEGNANKAYFDNISLTREDAQTMRYDEDGNLVSVLSPTLKEEVNSYENGNLIKTVTGGQGTYKYTYDSTYKHRLNSVTNDLITQSMTYDSAGNAVTTVLSGKGAKTIKTSAVYEDGLNRLSSITDAAGAKVTYGYGTNNAKMMALPTSVTDQKGTVTNTEYDSNHRVTKTGIADVADVVYNYSGGNLGSVQRKDSTGASQTYSFSYDAFGNMTALKVGSRTLATYTYYPGNGLLQKQSYGNGGWISFEYDSLGRTTKATYSNGLVVTYVYNGEGNLHKLTETQDGKTVTYVYTYDSVGRLIDSGKQEGEFVTFHSHEDYNSYNQLTRQGWQLGGNAYAQDYTYNANDGSLNTFAVLRNGSELAKFTMGYDELRRLNSIKSNVFNREYTYRDLSGEQTTTQIDSLTYKKTVFGNEFVAKKYAYTYDDVGNILTSTDNLNNVITYTYDKQGQLLTEKGSVSGFDSPPFNYSREYTYDSVGNILSAVDGKGTHTYTYGDGEWKDLLTAYDGEAITYDDSGNPTSYYNGNRWTFGWENGRWLASASKEPPVVITTQPENAFGEAGATATFTVAAKGDQLSYQWQSSTDDGKTWSNVSGGTSATLQVTVQPSSNGTLYRCVVQDAMGHVSKSQAGKLTVTGVAAAFNEFEPQYTMLNEPDDYYGRPGDTATFVVEVEGKELSYQWLYCPPGAGDFQYIPDATSNTLRVPMTEASDGASYRCFITDFTGNMGTSRIATVKLDTRDWQMEYDASGQRTKRISADKTYEYIYAGGKLMQMKVGKDVLEFGYDVDGKPLTMSLNGTVYYYITNLQGDVVSVENSDLTIASYAYDAWGNMTAISGTYAELNPLRYRGYVYDQELGLYYLESRYYDPAVGRFINADRAASTGQGIIGNNMFAYCGNNPTVRLDSDGEAFETIWDAVSLAASVADVAAKPYDPWAWIALAGDAADVLIPFVGGIGETTRVLKAASQAAELADKAADVKKGWKVGDDITNLTKAGKVPSWSTLKSRYWKNRAYYFPDDFKDAPENLKRMKAGRAPLVKEGGVFRPMELHHILGRKGNNYYIFFEITPRGHAKIDPFRHVK